NTDASLIVSYDLTGNATKWNDYRRYEGDMPVSIIIPAGAASAALVIYAVDDDEVEGPETVTLTIADDPNYLVGSPAGASVTINDNDAKRPARAHRRRRVKNHVAHPGFRRWHAACLEQ